MKEFYESNKAFQEYVNKYHIAQHMTLEETLESALVKEVARQYGFTEE